jgi:elongator complex protein 3
VKGLNKSTTLNEDTELAKNEDWSSKKQISKRFELYKLEDDIGIKCDLAVKGDSFGNHNPDYLRNFVKDIYDYLNGNISESLKDAAALQSVGKHRCVTFKVETRPDHINIKTCNLFLELGITTVELGVQSLNEDVLNINNRGHGLASIENATNLLRTFGFEVVYQVMVGLPGSNLNIDNSLLTTDLWQEKYNPDALKIYPCILLKKDIANQKMLFDLYNNGFWKPMNFMSYRNLLIKSYPKIPRYVHINRIQRIIPASKIEAGVDIEIDRMQFSTVSKCLWQRSVAQKSSNLNIDFSDYQIKYYLQRSNCYFFEALFSNDTVLGYGRLEILSKRSAIIRDIRVLGNMLPIGTRNTQKIGCQHIGIGTSIINKMEEVARLNNIEKLFVKPSYGTVKWFIRRNFKPLNSFYLGKKIISFSHSKIELPKKIKKLLIFDSQLD